MNNNSYISHTITEHTLYTLGGHAHMKNKVGIYFYLDQCYLIFTFLLTIYYVYTLFNTVMAISEEEMCLVIKEKNISLTEILNSSNLHHTRSIA